jgi:hypothetical protein
MNKTKGFPKGTNTKTRYDKGRFSYKLKCETQKTKTKHKMCKHKFKHNFIMTKYENINKVMM